MDRIRWPALGAAFFLSLGLAACDSGAPGADDMADTATPSTTAETDLSATPTDPAADQGQLSDYVQKAALSDMYEIESSKLALERSQVPEVKTFAQQMIDAHTATSEELKPMAMSAGLTVPAMLDEEHANKLQELQDASVEDFDDKYIDQQTAAHEAALDLHRNLAESDVANAQMKAFAAATWPKVQEHLDHVKQLDQSDADDRTEPSNAPSN